jgi:ankyrin repeat protein
VNLEQLRKQAKELVKAARDGDEEALGRLAGREPILARAQLVVAREHGYASWPALLAAAEADAERFVLLATDRQRQRAETMLAARPEIERDPWAGLVLGRGWRGDPNEPGGPRGWSPLLYACHSVFAPRGLVRELLGRGADPNRRLKTDWGETTALYGAAGVVHDPEITRLLLEAGADPDDNESVYHSLEAESTECLRLLLEHGAETRGTNALPHALDFDRLEPLRLLLEHGADPNEGSYVVQAVRRGRGPAFIRLLAEHGTELDRRGGEGWRNDPARRTGYQHAVLRGYDEVAQTLAELGASTEIDPVDATVAAFRRGEQSAASLPAELDPDQQEVLIKTALNGRLEEVLAVVGPDFRGVAGGSPEGTLLHHAAWFGNADATRILLAHGADPVALTRADFETPAAWAALGSSWWRTPGYDYVGVMEQLLDAGAELEPRFLDVAQGPLAEWLLERVSDERGAVR